MTQDRRRDGLYINYVYDWTSALTAVEENGATSGIGLLASYSYDNLGRLTGVSRGNGVSSSYSFDAVSRLSGFTHNPSGAALTVGLAHGPNGQIDTRTWTNAAYNWNGGVTATHTYTPNGQNQVTTNGAYSLTYDGRGNLNNDGTYAYTYDIENNLISRGTSTLAYDALGRLFQTSGSAVGLGALAFDAYSAVGDYNKCMSGH